MLLLPHPWRLFILLANLPFSAYNIVKFYIIVNGIRGENKKLGLFGRVYFWVFLVGGILKCCSKNWAILPNAGAAVASAKRTVRG